MNKLLLAILIASNYINLVYSQTFTEITDFGWGHEIADSGQTLYDINSNGLIDLVLVGSRGLVHFEQNDPNSLHFNVLLNSPLSDLQINQPIFVDLDNNGLLDMLHTDTINHRIIRSEQVSINSFEFETVSAYFSNINWVYETPIILDIDNDELLDMIVLKEYWDPTGADYYYNLYEQTYQYSPTFDLVVSHFLTYFADNLITPVICDIDNNNLLDLFIPNYDYYNQVYGLIRYEQIDEFLYDFQLINQSFSNLSLDFLIRPSFFDIDSNNLIDILFSEGNNEIIHYEQNSSNLYEFEITENVVTDIIDVGNYASPTIADIDNDGLWDLLIGNGNNSWSNITSNLYHYEQIESTSFEFEYVTDNFNMISGDTKCGPNLFDIDNDSLLDLLISHSDGHFAHYEQSSINSYNFDFISNNFSNLNFGGIQTTATFADFDNDNLYDLLISVYSHYEQTSINSYTFDYSNYIGSQLPNSNSQAYITDLDNDDLLDVIDGTAGGFLYHYEQSAMYSNQFTNRPNIILDTGMYSVPLACDINHNGYKDIILGTRQGGLYLYYQNPVPAEDEFTIQQSVILNQNYPNPFNPFTTFEFSIQHDSKIEFTIFNIKGQKVKTLTHDNYTTGSHAITWNGDNETGNPVSSGIYYYKLNINGKTEAIKKCLLLK